MNKHLIFLPSIFMHMRNHLHKFLVFLLKNSEPLDFLFLFGDCEKGGSQLFIYLVSLSLFTHDHWLAHLSAVLFDRAPIPSDHGLLLFLCQVSDVVLKLLHLL